MSLCWIWEKTHKWTRDPIRAVRLGRSAAECVCESAVPCYTCYKTHLYTSAWWSLRRSSLSFCTWTRLVTGALMLRSIYRTELTLLQIGTFVQQEGTAIYLLKPPLSFSLSANTFLWLVCNTFYRLCLWLTCVFGTFLCLLALWQCNSTVWTHKHFQSSQSHSCSLFVKPVPIMLE